MFDFNIGRNVLMLKNPQLFFKKNNFSYVHLVQFKYKVLFHFLQTVADFFLYELEINFMKIEMIAFPMARGSSIC